MNGEGVEGMVTLRSRCDSHTWAFRERVSIAADCLECVWVIFAKMGALFTSVAQRQSDRVRSTPLSSASSFVMCRLQHQSESRTLQLKKPAPE